MPNILNVIGKPTICDNGMSLIASGIILAADNWEAANMPPKIKLYSNDPVIGPAMVLADFTEATFTGYAEVIVDDLVAALTDEDVPVLQGAALASFVGGDPLTVPGTAQGYYLTNEAETILLGAERFEDNFPMDAPDDAIHITVRILLPGFTPAEEV